MHEVTLASSGEAAILTVGLSLYTALIRWRPDFGVNRRAQVLASVGDVTR
ncbi:hypothetical protein [Mycolicibacter arupensis]|nr:hypothetical protein [Mycolicibacter arupensis]MCV7275240.1 hypothetical protein [Mycolicibacter arupensis]